MKGISTFRRILWLSAALGIILVIVGVSYGSFVAYRDIQRLKSGSIWHIPSRIYSRPFMLSPGTDITRSGLMERLSRLRYRKVSKVTAPGEFMRSALGLTLYIHSFSYMGTRYKAQIVRLSLQDGKITEITVPGKKVNLKSALMEPECIGEIFDDLYEDRTIVTLNECPKHLLDAVIATEDRRFYSHWGIDYRSMIRAGISNLRHGAITEGGSTITQQLVKNLFLTHKRTVSRKLKDMWLAMIMEVVYSKEQILGMYINEIYMGSYGHAGVCGLGRASKMLFDKGISEISLSEAALLAAMIKAPNAYSPYAFPDKALSRRNMVLGLMLKQDRITQEEYGKAKKAPLKVVRLIPRKRPAPYFVDYTLALIRGEFSETLLEKGGYQIYTTLDMHMQRTAERLLAQSLSGKDRRIDGAAVIMDPANGEVLAMVGGKGYAASQFNRATKIRRQIGSLIKPMIYYTALKRGYTLTTFIEDEPLSIPQNDGTYWTPSNYDHISHGRVMLKDALANSYNLATVRLGMQLGVSDVLLDLCRVLPYTAGNTNPSLFLGALECSPLEVSAFYSAFANRGNEVRPFAVRAVYAEDGTLVRQYPASRPTPALDPTAVYLLNAALKEVVTSGTARESALYGMPSGVCGKTGTTDDARDSWFVGFTPRMVVTVWLGSDRYRSIGYSGAAGAMPVAAMILSRLSPPVIWPVPENIVICTIDPANGKLANIWTSGGVSVPYTRETQPTEVSDTFPSLPSLPDIPRAFDYLKSLIWKPSQ